MASIRGILNIQSLNELTSENCRCSCACLMDSCTPTGSHDQLTMIRVTIAGPTLSLCLATPMV